ncbi:MAG: hypothetical protein LBK53_04910 [Heliobacteriaceae bacterium]|nr:hypothetical protein [Heliobacteriaceae bacterium]
MKKLPAFKLLKNPEYSNYLLQPLKTLLGREKTGKILLFSCKIARANGKKHAVTCKTSIRDFPTLAICL